MIERKGHKRSSFRRCFLGIPLMRLQTADQPAFPSPNSLPPHAATELVDLDLVGLGVVGEVGEGAGGGALVGEDSAGLRVGAGGGEGVGGGGVVHGFGGEGGGLGGEDDVSVGEVGL